MSFIKCQWRSQDFRHSPDGNLSRGNPVKSRIKSIIITYQGCPKAASSPLANPWVKAGSSPHKKPQLRCWRRPLMVRQPYSEAVWAPSRAVGTSPVPWGERGLGKAVEPSLMVKKDGLILEKNLRFKGELVGFRKTLNAKEVFRKPFSRPIYKKIKHIFWSSAKNIKIRYVIPHNLVFLHISVQ